MIVIALVRWYIRRNISMKFTILSLWVSRYPSLYYKVEAFTWLIFIARSFMFRPKCSLLDAMLMPSKFYNHCIPWDTISFWHLFKKMRSIDSASTLEHMSRRVPPTNISESKHHLIIWEWTCLPFSTASKLEHAWGTMDKVK